MDRVFESGAVGSPPSAPASPSSGYTTAGNPATATPATKPGPYWFHQVTEELRAVIAAAGLAPDHTNLTQVRDAIQGLISANLGLGSGGIVLLNANTTLTNAAHVGKTMLFDGTATGAFTVTLPLANTVTTGKRMSFQNVSSYSVTVQRQGSNLIYPNSAGISAIVLGPGDTLAVEAYNGTSWFAVEGNGTLSLSTAFGTATKNALNASGAAPIYACRAWVNFNGTGTVAIRASGNVSSITDNGVGNYTVNFGTAMPDANFSTIATASNQPPYTDAGCGFACVALDSGGVPSASTGSVRILTTLDANGYGYDNASVSTNIAIFC